MSLSNILLLESVSPAAYRLLQENSRLWEAKNPGAGGEVAEQERIHAIVTRGKGNVNADLIQQCPDLKIIARCGVGLDNVDVNYATDRGIKVLFAPGSNADTVAEHALGLMLSLQRNLYRSFQAVKNKNWAFRNTYKGDELRGKTLGILGMGNIGKKVAKLAEAFGMRIVYWDLQEQNLPYTALPLVQLLQETDVLSLHLPLTPETKDLIDQQALTYMREHAIIINTARGGIIDEVALVEALATGRIAGFAADVMDEEPPGDDHPLLSMDNVLITPHSASLTTRTFNEMCVTTVQNTLDLLAGKPIDPRCIYNYKDLHS